ncbi:unnamed protein product [Allacma fusca]|uniref:Calponin-homology (CH) domain-containing protein n=1 Tax=Allacma fusca TaxID=39272 RepID=A0A8J2P2F7_9HEXA|nr:unnamed protein product [Allacma fusca]
MACIRSKYSNDSSEDLYGITRPPPEIHHKTIIQIYTDWANHYLEKARCKRHIQDLQVDVTDGVILSDVVEAVTNQKVPDVIRKPKNSSQMLDNIHSCLVFLAGLGVSLEGITARDIRDGHLKSILSLFFQLSRYKQQQKQQDRDRHNLQKQSAEMQQTGIKTVGPKHAQESSKLLPPFNKHAGNTSIPIPANASTPKKTPQEKGKSALGIGNGPHAFPCGKGV